VQSQSDPCTSIGAPGGRFLAFNAIRGATNYDLMILPMEGDATHGWTPGTLHGVSGHAGQRSGADVLTRRPLDLVPLD
jgi:hypothetical protein